MTTPKAKLSLPQIQHAAHHILKNLCSEWPKDFHWAEDICTAFERSASVESVRLLNKELGDWSYRIDACDDTALCVDRNPGLLIALMSCVSDTQWAIPAESADCVHAEAIAEIIAYRVANTTYGAGLFEAGFQFSHLSPLFRRVLKEGIDPEIVKVAQDTQPSYTGSRRYAPVVPITPKLRGQIVASLAARGFASELFESGGAWHIRSV